MSPLARIRRGPAFDAVLADMAGPEPASCRTLAARLGVRAMTVWHWRRLIMGTLASGGQLRLAGPHAAHRVDLRESRKGSREWVNHRRWPHLYPAPDRLRWQDYPCLGLAGPPEPERFLVPVLVLLDPAGCRTARPLPRPGATTVRRGPDVTPGSRRPRDCPLRGFLRPFCGPATRHLDGYLAWFSGIPAQVAAARVSPA